MKNDVVTIPTDEVDLFLEAQSGVIERSKDQKLCRHSSRARCAHCLPIDPFDETYLNEKDIKHMSFHAYIRKMTHGIKGKSSVMKYPLENLVCRVTPGCKEHPPYPAAVCLKCQPDPVTLQRQRYRHVDNISFENDLYLNRFLDFWRRTGHQRIGYLLGSFQAHPDVPLGIKAVVSAIYEPPQSSTSDSVSLGDDPRAQGVEDLCAELGLSRVGWIFTDLCPEGIDGKVKCTRNAESYLMSAQECITAGFFQNAHLNACKYAQEGYFGSKFVTVIASGDEQQQIHFNGYQVSNQCMALVADDWLVPTRDAPELAYVRDDKPAVPDVKYKEKDQYGNEVSKDGRPLPVEYLLIDVPCGMPKDKQYFFSVGANRTPFPAENREIIGELQNLNSLASYSNQFSANQTMEKLADFHLLLFLLTNDTCPIPLDSLRPLLAGIRNQDREAVFNWTRDCGEWVTIETLLAAQGAGGISGLPAANQNGANDPEIMEIPIKWACKHCTFENEGRSMDCEICGLPRN